MALLDVFVSQGLGTALIRRSDLTAAHLDTAFWISLSTGLLVAVVTLLGAAFVADVLSSPALVPILRTLAIVFPLSALGIVPGAILSREMAFDRFALRSVASILLGGAAGVAAAWAGWGVWALVTQTLVASSIGTAALWLATPWRPGLRVSRAAMADLWAWALALFGNDILWFCSRKGDETVVAGGLGTAALGSYSVANKLSTLCIDVLTSPIQTVAVPTLSRVQADGNKLARSIVEGSVWGAALGWPAFVGLYILAPYLVPLLFGAQWSVAVPVLQVLSVGGVLRAVCVMHHPGLLAINRPWTYVALLGLHSGLTVVASVLAVRTGRAEWVATSQAVAAGLTGTANFVVLFRATKFSWANLLEGLAAVAVSSILMGAIVVGVVSILNNHQLPPRVVVPVAIAAGALSYAAIASLSLRALIAPLIAAYRGGAITRASLVSRQSSIPQ
jgi:PST family polysaccharide transporter